MGFSTNLTWAWKHTGIIKKKTLPNLEKRQYLPHYWSDKSFKGTVVNQALPFLHGGSLTVSLNPFSLTEKSSLLLFKGYHNSGLLQVKRYNMLKSLIWM